MAAGGRRARPGTRGSVTLEHFYLTLQAALDGLGVAIGPERLVADDVAEGRLAKPFAGPSLPARSYCAYVPETRVHDPAVLAFCDWLRRAAAEPNSAQPSKVKPTTPLHLLGAYTGQAPRRCGDGAAECRSAKNWDNVAWSRKRSRHACQCMANAANQ